MRIVTVLIFFLISFAQNLSAQCIASAGVDASICVGNSVVLGSATVASGGTAPYTYQWAPSNGLSCTTCPNPTASPSITTTYTLTITDDNACTATDAVLVNVNTIPTASFTAAPAGSCANLPIYFTNTSSGINNTYSWSFGNPASGLANNSTQTNPSHEFISVGTTSASFTVSLTATSAQGCVSLPFTSNVTVLQTPSTVLFDPINNMKNCDGTVFDMLVFDAQPASSASNFKIIWGDGSPNYDAGIPPTSLSHSYLTQDIFDLNYIVTGINGCIDTSSYIVTNITNPAIGAANPGGTNGCGPLSICFPLSNFSSNHSSTTYLIDFGDGTPLLNLPHPPPNTICHTYLTTSCGYPGNSFTFKIKAINLCDSSEATITPIRVSTPPTANFSINPNPACAGSLVTFQNQTVNGFTVSSCSNFTQYEWDFGDGSPLVTGSTISNTNPTHIYTTPGTYSVSLTASNSVCGSSTIVKTICVEAPPVPNFSVNQDTACVSFTAIATDLSTLVNTCNVTYNWTVSFNGSLCLPSTGNWTFASGTNASSQNPQFTFNAIGSFTIQLQLTNSCGSYTFSKIVIVKGPPKVSVANITAICAGTSVIPVGTVNSCYSPIDLYAWTFTAGSPASSSSLTPGAITFPTAGTYPITLSASNACGTSSATKNVLVKPFPIAVNPTSNSPLCAGSSLLLSLTNAAGNTYVWTGPNGYSSTLATITRANSTTAFSGTYSVVASNSGCSAPAQSVTVLVNPLPTVSAGTAFSICKNASPYTLSGSPIGGTWTGTGVSAGVFNPSALNIGTHTLTYSYTDPVTLCSKSATVVATVLLPPTVNAGLDLNVCNQPIPVNLTASPTGGTWSGTGITNPSGVFTPSGVGSFILTYAFTSANGCSNSDQMTITVADPVAVNAGLDITVCQNSGSVNLSGSPANGTWSGIGVTSSGVYTPATVGTFDLVYTFGAGTCLSKDTLIAIVKPLPTVSAGTAFSICKNASPYTLSGSPIGGTWSGTGISAGIFDPSAINPGTYTLTYSYTDPTTLCSKSASIIATVLLPPTVSAGLDLNLCNQPITTTLSGTPAGGTWSGTGITNPTGVFTPSGVGSFDVTYTFTASNGCSNTDEATIIVSNPSISNAGLDTSVCQNSGFVNLSGLPANGTWSGTGITSSGVFTPATVGTFSLVYSIGSGTCLTSDAVQITVKPLPTVNAGAAFNICKNANPKTLIGSPLGGTWTGTGVSAGAFNPSALAAGNYTLTYSFTDPTTLCSNTSTVVATVLNPPIVDAGLDISLCNQPIDFTLSATPTGGTWSGTGISNPTGVFTPSGVGSFIVTYSFTDANACTSTDQITISVVNPGIADAGLDTAICVDAPNVQLSGLPIGGTWTGNGVNASGVFDPTVSGSFTLTYSIGSGTCLTSDAVLVTVKPLPTVSAGTAFNICKNANPKTLIGSPLGGTWTGTGVSAGAFNPSALAAGNYTLTYSFTDPTTLCSNTSTVVATVLNPPIVDAGLDISLCNQPIDFTLSATPTGGTWSGTGISNPTGVFTPSGVGSFIVTYSFTDANACTSTDQITISVVNPGIADAGLDTAICVDAPNVQLSGLPIGGTWTGNGVNASGVFDPTVSGSFTLTYSIGSGTCLTSDAVLVTVKPLPTVSAGTAFNICKNANPKTLIGSPLGGTWTGTGVSAGAFNPSALAAGNYTLTYSFTDPTTLCSNTSTVVATVLNPPIVDAGIDFNLCNQPIPATISGASPTGGTWSGTGITNSTGVFTPSGVGSFTVTYSFTDANGCTSTDQTIITVADPILANAGADVATCHNGGNLNVTGLPANGTWSGTGVTSSGIFSPTTVGTFDLVYAIGSGTCLTRDTMQVLVNPLPIVNIGANREFCLSENPVNLIPNITGGTWTGTGITDAALGTFSPATAGLGNHQIIYTYQNPVTSCINRDTMNILINPLPVVQFTHQSIACIGISESFTNTSTLGQSFAWNFGDGTTSNLENPTHAYLIADTFDVQLIVTTIKNCRDSLVQQIELRALPLADFSLTPDSSCAPVLVDFTNSSTGIGITHAWDFGNGQSSTNFTPPTQTYLQGYLADTTYYISLSVTNFCGTVVHTDSVVAMPKPTSIFGSNLNIGCSPFTVEFANNSLGLPETYFWDFGDGTTSTNPAALLNHVFITGTQDTIYTIMLVVSNACGTDTSYHEITVLPNLVNAFFNTSITTGCEDLTVDFTQYSTGTNNASWDFGDGNTTTTYSPTHTFTNPGNYQVNLYINDGCSFDTATVAITVYPSPVVNFSFAPDSVCINEIFQFTNGSQNLSNSAWSFGDGGTSNLVNPSHAYIASGTYPVTLTGTSPANGCTSSITKNVIVSIQPDAAFTANPMAGCVPLSVNFSQVGTHVSFQSWNFGDGNLSALANPQHTFTQVGSYTVGHFVENINGCKDSSFQIITVYPLPVANFSLTSTDPCFAPVTVNTNNISTGSINFQWDFGNGITSNLTNETVVFANPGTYNVSLTATSIHGCTNTLVVPFTVYPRPVAVFTVSSQTICEGQSVIFSSQSTFADSLVWDMGDGTILIGNSVVYTYPTAGNYPITLSVYGAGGCSDISILNPGIQVNPTPIAGFEFINIQNHDPLSGTVEFTNQSQYAGAYDWQFGNGHSSSEINPTEKYYQYGTFEVTLIASNQFGCADTLVQLIKTDFDAGLFVPNAMYPGHSSFGVSHFLPKGVGLESYTLTIYDAWGNTMWSTSSLDLDGRPNEAWDGKFKGEYVKEDAYVWKVNATFLDANAWKGKEYARGKFKRSGTVTVIR
ncbi:MAG: PKD domain-containing protein [Crocinitomicaceae bacterium]|nr:PKD domain-containing protein [Crocinitomicaceae bacterium]